MFILKKGLFSILVQNSAKVTKKVLVFRNVARSCSLTKKLLKILKVAKKLSSRIWKGLAKAMKTSLKTERSGSVPEWSERWTCNTEAPSSGPTLTTSWICSR